MSRRWIIAGPVVALLAAAGGLFYLWRSEPTQRVAPDAQAAKAAPNSARSRAEQTSPAADSFAAPATNVRLTARVERTGHGRIFGTATLPPRAPRGLPISIALHHVNTSTAEVSYDETLVGTAEVDAKGAFEFTRLPEGDYVLFATAAGYTMHAEPYLSVDREEYEVTLTLVPGGMISGRVVDAAHAAVPGAQVFIGGWDIQRQKRTAPRGIALASRVATDAAGAFTIGNLRSSLNNEPGFQLGVRAAGHATFLSDYIRAGTEGVELVLTNGVALTGQLVDTATNAPIPAKTVALDSELAIEQLVAKTDAEGFFFMTNVSSGKHIANLIDDRLVITPETAQVEVTDGAPREVVLKAGEGGKISGRVYDKASGEGIAHVPLTLQPRQRGLDSFRRLMTGADGTFETLGLRAGPYAVICGTAEGYGEPERSEERERIVQAKVNETASGVDFALFRGARVSGRVVDESGRPVAHARVELHNSHGWGTSTQSSESGTFMSGGYEANETVRVQASAEGYALLAITPPDGKVKLAGGDYAGVEIVMGEPSSISGLVVDAVGSPKPGVPMYAYNMDSDHGWNGSSATSAADGAITFKNVGAGTYEMRFVIDGRSSSSSAWKKVKVAKAEHVMGMKFVVPDAGKLTIAGKISDSTGKPVADAYVTFWDGDHRPQARSDASGAYTLNGLNDRDYIIFAAASGYSYSTPKTVQAGSTGIDFVLNASATIDGRVVSVQGGQAVTAFRIRAQFTSGIAMTWGAQYMPVQDANGAFHLTNVDAGCTKLFVRSDGFADSSVTIPAIQAGEQRRDVVIRLENGNELTGRVIDQAGAAIPDAQIFVADGSLSYWDFLGKSSNASAADGSYRLGALPPGEAQLWATHPQHVTKIARVTIVSGAQNHADLVMSSGGSVEGVVRLDGKPMEDQSVSASGNTDAGDSRNVKTDAQGRYRIVGLSSGAVHLNPSMHVKGAAFQGKSATATVTEGFVTQQDFDFYSGTASIEGTVFTAPGKPVRGGQNVSYWILHADGLSDYSSTSTDDAGSFKFENMPAGHLRLQVEGERNEQFSVSLDVAEGQHLRRDILLYGGSTVHVSVSGGTGAIVGGNVRLLPGVVAIANPTTSEFFRTYANQFVAYVEMRGALGDIPNVDPGTYTVIAIAGGGWGTATIEVKKDEDVSVSIAMKN